jgi:hypothetical protein
VQSDTGKLGGAVQSLLIEHSGIKQHGQAVGKRFQCGVRNAECGMKSAAL